MNIFMLIATGIRQIIASEHRSWTCLFILQVGMFAHATLTYVKFLALYVELYVKWFPASVWISKQVVCYGSGMVGRRGTFWKVKYQPSRFEMFHILELWTSRHRHYPRHFSEKIIGSRYMKGNWLAVYGE